MSIFGVVLNFIKNMFDIYMEDIRNDKLQRNNRW